MDPRDPDPHIPDPWIRDPDPTISDPRILRTTTITDFQHNKDYFYSYENS